MPQVLTKNRKEFLLVLVLLWAAVSLTSGRGLVEKIAYAKVKDHASGRQGGGMGPFYNHGVALTGMAIGGNDQALLAFLEGVRHCDGANSYAQFNLTIDCLRKIDDQRFARAVSALDPATKARVWHYLSYVSDLNILKPSTLVALGIDEAPDKDALPLHDARQIWP